MDTLQTHGHPILILGAGRGGTAMLEMFMEDELACIVGVSDSNPEAPGLVLARHHGIRTFSDAEKALRACAPCLAINLTLDESISKLATGIVGANCVMGGQEAKLMWLMVTRLKKTRDELEKSQNELQAIIQTAIDGIITINECGGIVSFNPSAETIFGYSKDEIIGKNINLLMPEPERGRHDAYIQRYISTGIGRIIGVGGREVIALRKDGSTFPMELSVSEMVLQDSRYFVGIVRDISDRKAAEEKIRLMAQYDQLTGLPNRNLFFDRLEQSLAQAKRHKHKVAVLFLDLDRFKPINDTYGHDAGDKLLQKVAKRLLGSVREVDTVARIGGDEFIILLAEIAEEKNAARIAGKILAKLTEPIVLKNVECGIGGSIGIALFPDDATDKEALLKKADDGMYHAKNTGKNNYKFYHEITANKGDQGC